MLMLLLPLILICEVRIFRTCSHSFFHTVLSQITWLSLTKAIILLPISNLEISYHSFKNIFLLLHGFASSFNLWKFFSFSQLITRFIMDNTNLFQCCHCLLPLYLCYPYSGGAIHDLYTISCLVQKEILCLMKTPYTPFFLNVIHLCLLLSNPEIFLEEVHLLTGNFLDRDGQDILQRSLLH